MMGGRKLTKDIKYVSAILIIFGTCCAALPLQTDDLDARLALLQEQLRTLHLSSLQEQLAMARERAKQDAMQQIGVIFREQCRNGDDEDALELFKTSFWDFYSCAFQLFTGYESIGGDEDPYRAGAEMMCEKYMNFKPCAGDFILSLDICQTKEKSSPKDTRDIVYESIDYMCGEGPKKLEEVLREISPECGLDLHADVGSCLVELQSSTGIGNFTLNDDGCRVLMEAEECIGSRVKRCGGPKTEALVDGLAAIGLRRLPCGQRHAGRLISAASAPAASPAPAPAALALLALLAACLLRRGAPC